MAQTISIADKLIALKEQESGHITFHFRDGSKQRTPINKQFFYDEKGRDLSSSKVAQKINDLCHDLHAEYYEIE